ncbi:acyl-CoA dehydrogenase [Erwinia sp. E602]|uniref:acyl-CoA dehydrogenase C-terminal domain-containing protein n=1 Tax=Erwinia sp. E602 TaxID=2675378 RepID=UPI001BA8FD67|nr:acyl-CoA dehydrogenase C-terminal domain-containing protein [Erwinia sp. E602]QUG76973.1 acyl-CoA dehydrogenase [Erwinia sp. E602]
MSHYQAPLRDMSFVRQEMFASQQRWQRLPGLNHLDDDTATAVLSGAATVAAEIIDPLNPTGDRDGVRFKQGKVTTPPGFKDAFDAFVGGGWNRIAAAVEFGGMGMPASVGMATNEMFYAAGIAFTMYSGLTSAACTAIAATGSEALKQRYLPPMIAGKWAGTMCLTESQAGTDLGLMRTRAEKQPDGSYRISGSKIFISGGEQDLTENIIHLVLARLPDAPAGSRGISLFLVPKVLPDEAGALGPHNALSCGSVENKMGIHGSATCVMNFDGAKGWLLGEENKGLQAMFIMMNHERLGVGNMGVAVGERAYQRAVAYARERLQGRAVGAPAGSPPQPLIAHGDVRRMLLTMKALTEGGRALIGYIARLLELEKYSEESDERVRAGNLVALLTPVAKAFSTDMGFACCVDGQQIFGGHGYIREHGIEQLVRDARITQIYEGANGVQAADLLGRKTLKCGGQFLTQWLSEIREFMTGVAPAIRSEFNPQLEAVMGDVESLTQNLLARLGEDPDEAGAAATEYLHIIGYLTHAYLWLRAADIALRKLDSEPDFYRVKLQTARFYYARILPRIHSLIICVEAGGNTLSVMKPDDF